MSAKGQPRTSHGLYKSYIYATWWGMRKRCYNPKHTSFKDYGGRGIVVCDEWVDDFLQFVRDMGERPSEQHSLDRKDNDGPYSPANCRWATASEQVQNRRLAKICRNKLHPMSGDNVYTEPSGCRKCRTCLSVTSRKKYLRRREKHRGER